MSKGEFLDALKDMVQRAENEEGYLESIADDVQNLLDEGVE